MKKDMFQRLISLAAALGMTVSLTACGEAPTGNSGEVYRVAVIKQTDHPSLDEIAAAVTTRLEEISQEQGVSIRWEVTSGQGDQTTLKQLGDQAVAGGADVLLPIATTAAQIAALCAGERHTPVVYAAVSDPEAAGLTGLPHVTGVSDGLDTNFLLGMMLAENPNTAKVGLLYSLSEVNSAAPIAEAKAWLEDRGIPYVAHTASTSDEVISAAAALIASGVDAVFTPADNVIMAAELAIYEDFARAGVRHYAGADSFARSGAFASCGVNYTRLGEQTAQLAFRAVTEGMEGLEDCYPSNDGIITVNTETAAALGADYSVFAGMGELVEVATSGD